MKNFFKGWVEESPQANATNDGTSPDAPVSTGNHKDFKLSPPLESRENIFASSSAVPDEQYLNAIEQKIEESDQPGIEYFEFAKTMRSFMNQGQTAENAMKTTMTALTVASPDLTVQVLMNTSDHYINVVKEMCEQFIAESNDNIRKEEEKFGSFESDFDELLDTLDDDDATEEILSAVKPIFEKSLRKVSQKELNRQSKMNVAAELVVNNIKVDQENIQKFLNL